MTDKERILTHIISRIITNTRYNNPKFDVFETPEKGNIALALTSGTHDFTVGYVEHVYDKSHLLIREITSSRTCDISNEMFYQLPKDWFSPYELLAGAERKTYLKVCKAFKPHYINRMHSVEFKSGICTVKARKMFSDIPILEFSFRYNSKTTIKEISRLLEEELEKIERVEVDDRH